MLETLNVYRLAIVEMEAFRQARVTPTLLDHSVRQLGLKRSCPIAVCDLIVNADGHFVLSATAVLAGDSCKAAFVNWVFVPWWSFFSWSG